MSGTRVLDAADRILVGTDGGLIEVDAAGRSTPLAATTGEARYLPGTRDVVHQDGPTITLRSRGRAKPLRKSDHAVELLGVLPGRVVYRANPRHRLLWDVVIRNVLVGEEQTVYSAAATSGRRRSARTAATSRCACPASSCWSTRCRSPRTTTSASSAPSPPTAATTT
ncbi:hypothetical protein ACFQV2_00775 [Actinokineospora soli]|uniref:Uncharacterized protein n=1 Tax=Actinokineospora soli TaxID=1048753 RepID=A0ABW2TFE1_9PSEU